MQQLGLVLTEDDVHAMMKSAGIGPHGKISYAGELRRMIEASNSELMFDLHIGLGFNHLPHGYNDPNDLGDVFCHP